MFKYLHRSTRLMKTWKSLGTEGWTPATGSEVGAASSEGFASGSFASWSDLKINVIGTLKMPHYQCTHYQCTHYPHTTNGYTSSQ